MLEVQNGSSRDFQVDAKDDCLVAIDTEYLDQELLAALPGPMFDWSQPWRDIWEFSRDHAESL